MKHGASKVLGVGCILLVALFLFYALSSLPQPVQAQTVTATIPVGTYPTVVASTPDGAYVYVTNDLNSSVSVISTATNTVSATVTVGNQPSGLAVTPDGTYAYVANEEGNTVSVISTSNAITSPTPTASRHQAQPYPSLALHRSF